MISQDYIGWATGVNNIILDSTNLTFGENAVRTDELESGLKRSVQKGAFNPDRYAVKMSFDWVNEVVLHHYDANGEIIPGQDIHTGKTEFQLFTEWYKYRHKYGSVPFEFPKILYSQNTGITVLDPLYNMPSTEYHPYQQIDVEYYKITSSVTGAKSGEHISVDMTWETVYGGTLTIENQLPAVVGIGATTKYVDVFFSNMGDVAPVSQLFTVYVDNTAVELEGFCFDGSKTVRLYYDEINTGSEVTIAISNYEGLTVAAGVFVSEV